jgi:hypothetical protein
MSDTNSYRSVDFLLNILYDKLYNKDSNKSYIIPPISRNDINVSHLKRKYTDEIDVLFNSDITYENNVNDKWVFKCKSKTAYPCLIVVSEYDTDNLNYDDMGRKELINMAFHYMTSELVLSKGRNCEYYN